MCFVLKFPADAVSALKCAQGLDALHSRRNVSKDRRYQRLACIPSNSGMINIDESQGVWKETNTV
jgi:hypothetical protein